ncbi:hypothetical protein J6590_018453 [Homalodisca vitripennis]|nr:hypothetical protein J6590_018453 [Homalodisca vitripennis]
MPCIINPKGSEEVGLSANLFYKACQFEQLVSTWIRLTSFFEVPSIEMTWLIEDLRIHNYWPLEPPKLAYSSFRPQRKHLVTKFLVNTFLGFTFYST